jgi:hypothetical protein
MSTVQALRLRRSTRTLAEIEALVDTVRDWRRERHGLDVDSAGKHAGRHKSQIDTIAEAVGSIAASLRKRHEGTATMSDDDCFDMLALLDDSVIWLDRVFQFFAAKFAQRELGQGPVLRAADEVVWSCYEPVMRAAGKRDVMPPPPLPFIARELSPAAIVHDTPLPPPLRAPLEFGGKPVALLDKIPVPLLRLPPHVERAPWTLVFAAHEAAHYLVNDLALGGHFANGIAGAGAAGVATEEQWRHWSEEIAADFMALLLLGTASRDALVEELWGSSASMKARPGEHPPPRLRIAVLDTAAQRIGVPVTGSLADDKHMPLVEFLRAPAPGIGKLEALCGFEGKRVAREIQYWEGEMRTESAVDYRDFDAPRYAAAAAYRAWTALAGGGDGLSRVALARRACELIAGAGPLGERDAVTPPALDSADALTNLLINDVKARREERQTRMTDAL